MVKRDHLGSVSSFLFSFFYLVFFIGYLSFSSFLPHPHYCFTFCHTFGVNSHKEGWLVPSTEKGSFGKLNVCESTLKWESLFSQMHACVHTHPVLWEQSMIRTVAYKKVNSLASLHFPVNNNSTKEIVNFPTHCGLNHNFLPCGYFLDVFQVGSTLAQP